MTGPYRHPAEESEGLYPHLVVHDGRVSGSITLGRSRLPVWCLAVAFPEWDSFATDQQEPGAPHYGVSKDDLAEFIHHLLDVRGELARLLLVLANAEREEDDTGDYHPWWDDAQVRGRVVEQLRRCVAALEGEAGG